MTHPRPVARLDEVAVGLARHGWHVRCAPAPDDERALLVRARCSGERTYRTTLDDAGLVLTREDPEGAAGGPLGVAGTTEELHDLLRADVREVREARETRGARRHVAAA